MAIIPHQLVGDLQNTSVHRLPSECQLEALDQLDPIDLLTLAQVDVQFRTLVILTFRSRLFFSLSPFVTPYKLLNVLRRVDAVIGGSLPLQLVTTAAIVPNNLDIYTTQQGETRILMLLRAEGYLQTSTKSAEQLYRCYDQDLIQSMFTFSRTRAQRTMTVNIFVTITSSTLVPILDTDFTWTMTAVTAEGIFVPYPTMTLHMQGVHNRDSPSLARIEKYRDRGFTNIESRLTLSQQKLMEDSRNIRDCHTLLIPIDPDAPAAGWFNERDNVYWSSRRPRYNRDRDPYLFDGKTGQGVMGSVINVPKKPTALLFRRR